MEESIITPFLQTRNLHVRICTIVFLLTCGDVTKSYERNILHQMNRTAVKGETVILHCNGTLSSGNIDIVWRKDGNVLFNYSPVINQTVTNYTSSRMQVDPRNPRKLQISDVQLSDAGLYSCFPLDMQWILTIEGQGHGESRAYPRNTGRETVNAETKSLTQKMLLYILPSVTGAVAICLIIFCAVCIHRKWKRKVASDHRDTVDDRQPRGRRMNHNRSSQYFERFNSVYGQFQI
ncbi:hypothetical protein PHYPO_G00249420 [Pangasianodon hypophthalmus]|uniref:Ig-like domain-containing protein n=1 Tax=Pangasianodon hypophthalmus TaxID=310915 RepID=A0A5N5J7P5_PANHP|nr:hypothetical protein PHYPO_G00249420 [Pangasianodon hypophthalmus]